MEEAFPSRARAPDRTLPVLCHLLGLLWMTGVPLANVLGPLALWLWKRDRDPEVDLHGKESINFQISICIYAFAAGLAIFLLIGFVLLPIVLLTALVCTILAAVKAGKGELYRYPLSIRFLK